MRHLGFRFVGIHQRLLSLAIIDAQSHGLLGRLVCMYIFLENSQSVVAKASLANRPQVSLHGFLPLPSLMILPLAMRHEIVLSLKPFCAFDAVVSS
jgi:hypothetical protein